jgi:hypothetical protein
MNARIVFKTQVKHTLVAPVLARFSTIPFAPDFAGWQACYGPPISVCDDSTVEDPPGSGILKRTLKILYSPEFEAAFPTADIKRHQLRQFGLGILSANLPGTVEVDEVASDYEANDCP